MKGVRPSEWAEKAGLFAREMPVRTLAVILVGVLFAAWIFSEPIFRLHDRFKRGTRKKSSERI